MRKLFSLFRLTGFYILDFFAALAGGRKNSSGLLLVRLDAIGDFILWTDSAKEFRRLYPGRKITLCANSVWSDLASKLSIWDEIWPVDIWRLNRNPIYRFRTLRKIRQRGFEIAIQPTFSRLFLHGDAIIRATGSQQRIGYAGDTSNISPILKTISDHWYSKLVPASPAPLMELERNAEFIRNLSGQDFKAELPILPRLIDLPDRLKFDAPYFIVFPGASWCGKQWPAERFAEIVTQLHGKFAWLPVLCGGQSDIGLCQTVIDLSGVQAVNLGGATSLPELVELVRGARLLISNDTSAVHLAAAVSTPAVCILGGGHFGRFLPYPENISGTKPAAAIHEMSCYHCNWICSQAHDPAGAVPCISGVSVEAVSEMVDQILEGREPLETGKSKRNLDVN
jgi:ADP-heptose:LPS heptosyltransferase